MCIRYVFRWRKGATTQAQTIKQCYVVKLWRSRSHTCYMYTRLWCILQAAPLGRGIEKTGAKNGSAPLARSNTRASFGVESSWFSSLINTNKASLEYALTNSLPSVNSTMETTRATSLLPQQYTCPQRPTCSPACCLFRQRLVERFPAQGKRLEDRIVVWTPLL